MRYVHRAVKIGPCGVLKDKEKDKKYHHWGEHLGIAAAGCPSCRPTNSDKALKETDTHIYTKFETDAANTRWQNVNNRSSSRLLSSSGDNEQPTLIPVGDWRFLNESIWMISSWMYRACARRQRRSHIYATLQSEAQH